MYSKFSIMKTFQYLSSKDKKKTEQPKLTFGKRIVFALITVLIPILILIILESGLRIFNYGYDLKLFNSSVLYPGYYEINRNVGKRYFTKFHATDPANDIFLIRKPDTCYRIFVLGCSTTRGFPYQSGTMFSRILNYRLQDAFPHKLIEVVNISMSAVNSFTVLDVIDEVLQQQPDAVLIYTGHNEYYGAMGVGSVENGGNQRWLKILHLKLNPFRTYQLIQQIISKTTKLLVKDESKGSLMERIVKEKSIVFGSPMYEEGIEQFRSNMSEIVEKVRKAGVPIIMSELVSNIRDQKPFKSIEIQNEPNADELYKQAQQLEKQGRYEEARRYYYNSKDYDAIRFRAPEAFNDVINNLGKTYHITIVPMKKYFENHSPDGLIGYNLMLEHLHPNINGYFLMSEAFFSAMRNEGLIAKKWDTTLIKSSEYYRNNWGFTTLDSLTGDLKIKMVLSGWPFQPDTVINMFKYTYLPKSHIDSVAFKCATEETVHIEDEHISLAKYYARQGDFHSAFEEYLSLIKCYPHVSDLYLDAVYYLMSAGEYKKSFELISEIPNRDNNFTALFQLGTIYLKLNMTDNAISSLNNALKIFRQGDNRKGVLISLYEAYKAKGYKIRQNQILAEIKTIDPKFHSEPGNIENSSIKKEVKALLSQATKLARQGNFDKSLQVLNQSLKIQETALANQMIGSILFQKKDIGALKYYEKAYAQDPEDPDILNNLIILYLIKKDIPNARKCLDEFRLVANDYEKIQRLEKLFDKTLKASGN
jgi:tetratricopeptide (TPR) repeat protein